MSPEERAELEGLRQAVLTLDSKIIVLADIIVDHVSMSLRIAAAAMEPDGAKRAAQISEALTMARGIKDAFEKEHHTQAEDQTNE